MSLSKKKDPTAPAEEIKTDSASSDELETVSAAEVDEVMKKYDRESNTRIWTGAPQIVIRCIMALFSVYCIFSTLWSTASLEVRLMIFLGCVDLMGFLYYPMSKHHVKENYIPWFDWIIMIVGSACFFYYAFNFDSIIAVLTSASKMTPTFIVIGIVGILSLVELCRRCVGVPILCVAGALVVYTFWSMLSKGMDIQLVLGRVIYTLFYTTGGVIGPPINVCAKFIVVFIVFGAFLERTGIAKFFIDLANKVAGASSGGPAKVAVISSALCGMVSGSSVGNTVTTGSVTIPMMKKTGYKPEFAGSVEAASSTGGQIMPPIMGAAAFIMAQFLGVGYVEIAKAALVPALLYYLAVGFMVHMEAKRLGLKGIPKERLPRTWVVLRQGGYLLIPIIVLIYMLMQGYTPLKAAYYCIVTTVVISLVAENWKTWHGARYSNENVMSALAQTNFLSLKGVLQAMENGGRLALGVAAACACTGFVIGVVTLTGLGLKLANAILTISADSFALTLLLTIMGLVMLFSASFPSANYESGDPAYYLKRQGLFALLGLVAMLAMARIDYHRLRGMTKILMYVSVFLLALVLALVLLTGCEFSLERLAHGGALPPPPED